MDSMRKNEALIRTLCRPYCRYYKQGKNEDLLCRGAVVVERLILSGKSIVPPVRKKQQHHAAPSIRELVVNCLCAACAFRQNDCDFAEDGTSEPCGGFVLLLGLLEQGLITIEDMQ